MIMQGFPIVDIEDKVRNKDIAPELLQIAFYSAIRIVAESVSKVPIGPSAVTCVGPKEYDEATQRMLALVGDDLHGMSEFYKAWSQSVLSYVLSLKKELVGNRKLYSRIPDIVGERFRITTDKSRKVLAPLL